ncbi:MAG: LPS export ABC transporter permease LptG [Oligoflexia bacterium]|nr:LPS export ABC transporter permease LptG [Oligoflexia bacterium]
MKKLQRYILGFALRNLLLSLMVFVLLFLVIDFFDHIDNLVIEDASLWSTVQYFLYKIPLTLTLMFPVAVLSATMMTFGTLSKNSEMTAMRAAGARLLWLAKPAILMGLCVSLLTLLLNETLVPYATRRVKEIYNIDIRQKDKRGGYNQEDFWWRDGNEFFSADIFDSRDNTLHGVSRFVLSSDFKVAERTDAETVSWIDPVLKWNMRKVSEYTFVKKKDAEGNRIDQEGIPDIKVQTYRELPLPIREDPENFYDTRTDTQTMSFRQLQKFIRRQRSNGLSISEYTADLHAKLSFPFACLVVVLAVLPFSLRSARSGSMAPGIIASLGIGFAYFSIHSFSIALGRAELWPAVLAAWMANIIIGSIGLILCLGAESP